MQKLALLALPALILISGCTSAGSGTGVIIENFEPDFTDVFIQEPVAFRVKIRNAGSVDSLGGKVEILGLEDWGPKPSACQYSERLLAGQSSFGTIGEVLVCPPFEYSAPEVPQGISVTYQPTARLSYSYASNMVKTLTLAGRDELRRIENLGGALPAETTSVSSGPVSINVLNKGPIRVFSGGVRFPIEITVSNVGGGVVCKGGYESCRENSNWNKLDITASLGGEPIEGCSGKELTLFRGQSNSITCQAQVSLSDEGIIQKTIKVESSYGYFTDSLSSVTVSWREL